MTSALLSQPIVPLNDSHDRRFFVCGIDSLDRYVRVQAGQDQRRNIAACFILSDAQRSRIAGYYTLSAFSLVVEGLPESLQKKLPKYAQVPCTLLGRLAVDAEYRALGIGRHLLIDGLQRALIHSVEVASWAVVVEAIDDAAQSFYQRFGFISLPRAARRLFLPMATLERLFGS